MQLYNLLQNVAIFVLITDAFEARVTPNVVLAPVSHDMPQPNSQLAEREDKLQNQKHTYNGLKVDLYSEKLYNCVMYCEICIFTAIRKHSKLPTVLFTFNYITFILSICSEQMLKIQQDRTNCSPLLAVIPILVTVMSVE